MPGGIQGLIQTIVALKRLQLDEASQQLQQEQLGISRGQLGVSQGNLQLAQSQRPLNTIAALQGVLQHTDNPAAFSPYAPQFAQQAGVDPSMIQQFMQQTPAATETTRARAVQGGARQADGRLNAPAANTALTGAGAGELAKDNLLAQIFGQTGDYYSSLPDDQREVFTKSVLQKAATGQSMSEAAMDVASADFMGRANKETKDLIVKIGKGLAPSASEDAQTRLGWARYRLDNRQFETNASLEDLKVRAGLANARAQLDAKAFEDVNNLILHRSELLSNMTRNAATMTPEGIRSFAEQLNAFNAQMRNAAPTIYGPHGTNPISDIPINSTLGATGIADYLSARLKQP